MRTDAYIAIGSNLGDRGANIAAALGAIEDLGLTEIVRCSCLIETAPIGPGAQGDYLNGAAHLRTGLSPIELLGGLLKIELDLGRDRQGEVRWGPRTLDLDLLVFGERIIDEDGLLVPHPRLHERVFVLAPLCEIAPDLRIPGHEKTPRELLGALESVG